MKQGFIFILILTSFSAFCQGNGEDKDPSKESEAYHIYRIYESTPPYGLSKITRLTLQIRDKYSADGELESAMDKKTFNALSLREKFTYTMIHPESYNQVCDVDPPVQEEQTKLFGVLADFWGEEAWSERQYKFMKDNRDSVMALIKENSTSSKRMGANYKSAIEALNGVELIPFLIKFYNEEKKDGDILTLMMILMKENKYEPFLSSTSYKKLYGENSNYMAFIVYNKANEELIIKRATEFYNARAK